MNWKKIVLLALGVVVLVGGTLIFLNRDKMVYVGSLEPVEVDCSRQGEILDEVFTNDQRVRKGNVPFSELAKVDHENQELVMGILEQCGMPTLEEVNKRQLNTIWLVLQHTQKKVRKQYFPQIEAAFKNGDFNGEQYALMKDRILMDEGKPQLYGTQISNGKLYKLSNPETVNERREEMGMEPIEQYLKQYNIEFKLD